MPKYNDFDLDLQNSNIPYQNEALSMSLHKTICRCLPENTYWTCGGGRKDDTNPRPACDMD